MDQRSVRVIVIDPIDGVKPPTVPIGGVLISKEFEAWHGMLGTTFGGTHLACIAGLSVLEIIENENLVSNANDMGTFLINSLLQFSEIKEIRGKGCMIGIELTFPIKEFRKVLIEKYRVFTGSSTQPNTLRILPPLTVNKKEIDEFINAFGSCLQEFKKSSNYEPFFID